MPRVDVRRATCLFKWGPIIGHNAIGHKVCVSIQHERGNGGKLFFKAERGGGAPKTTREYLIRQVVRCGANAGVCLTIGGGARHANNMTPRGRRLGPEACVIMQLRTITTIASCAPRVVTGDRRPPIAGVADRRAGPGLRTETEIISRSRRGIREWDR
jgi:hypothetical protein